MRQQICLYFQYKTARSSELQAILAKARQKSEQPEETF